MFSVALNFAGCCNVRGELTSFCDGAGMQVKWRVRKGGNRRVRAVWARVVAPCRRGSDASMGVVLEGDALGLSTAQAAHESFSKPIPLGPVSLGR